MQPISALPLADARSFEGVCFDIDDTVTSHGVLDVEAYRAMFALRDAGLKLIAVTGRPLGFAEIFARSWPVDAAVGENGAGFIAREGKRLRFGYWDSEDERERQQTRLDQMRMRVAREMPHVKVSNDSWARRCDLAFDVNEYEQLARADIDRLVAILESEGARTTVSSVHAHAQLGDHDKASGVAFAARELWGLPEATMQTTFLFVGDSGNDAAAFAWFAHSAGVANVARYLDRLPRPPRYVASREHGQGFAEIAEHVLRARSTSP